MYSCLRKIAGYFLPVFLVQAGKFRDGVMCLNLSGTMTAMLLG